MEECIYSCDFNTYIHPSDTSSQTISFWVPFSSKMCEIEITTGNVFAIWHASLLIVPSPPLKIWGKGVCSYVQSRSLFLVMVELFLWGIHMPIFLAYYTALCSRHMMYGFVPAPCNITSPYVVVQSLFLTSVVSVVPCSVICHRTALHSAAGTPG